MRAYARFPDRQLPRCRRAPAPLRRKAGNANYTAAAQVTQSMTVTAAKKGQTITFGAAPTVTVGKTGTVSATSSSGLAVTLTSTTKSVCTTSGTTVTGVAAGTCTIAENQAANSAYAPAPQVTQNIGVGKGSQTITLTVPTSITRPSTGKVTATATSGLAVALIRTDSTLVLYRTLEQRFGVNLPTFDSVKLPVKQKTIHPTRQEFSLNSSAVDSMFRFYPLYQSSF